MAWVLKTREAKRDEEEERKSRKVERLRQTQSGSIRVDGEDFRSRLGSVPMDREWFRQRADSEYGFGRHSLRDSIRSSVGARPRLDSTFGMFTQDGIAERISSDAWNSGRLSGSQSSGEVRQHGTRIPQDYDGSPELRTKLLEDVEKQFVLLGHPAFVVQMENTKGSGVEMVFSVEHIRKFQEQLVEVLAH